MLRQRNFKMPNLVVGLLFSIFILHCTLALKGPNICTKQETQIKSVRVTYLQPYQVKTYTWCFAIPPRCSKFKIKHKVAYKTEAVAETKTIELVRMESGELDVRIIVNAKMEPDVTLYMETAPALKAGLEHIVRHHAPMGLMDWSVRRHVDVRMALSVIPFLGHALVLLGGLDHCVKTHVQKVLMENSVHLCAIVRMEEPAIISQESATVLKAGWETCVEILVQEIAGDLDARIVVLVTMMESAIQSMGAAHALQVIGDYSARCSVLLVGLVWTVVVSAYVKMEEFVLTLMALAHARMDGQANCARNVLALHTSMDMTAPKFVTVNPSTLNFVTHGVVIAGVSLVGMVHVVPGLVQHTPLARIVKICVTVKMMHSAMLRMAPVSVLLVSDSFSKVTEVHCVKRSALKDDLVKIVASHADAKIMPTAHILMATVTVNQAGKVSNVMCHVQLVIMEPSAKKHVHATMGPHAIISQVPVHVLLATRTTVPVIHVPVHVFVRGDGLDPTAINHVLLDSMDRIVKNLVLFATMENVFVCLAGEGKHVRSLALRVPLALAVYRNVLVCMEASVGPMMANAGVLLDGWVLTVRKVFCPEGYFGDHCIQACQCPNQNFRCHPVEGCTCRAGYTGKECNIPVVLPNIQPHPESREIQGSSSGGLIAGIVVTLLVILVVAGLMFYYRRRLYHLKTELQQVYFHNAPPPDQRHFDNPVYEYQATSKPDVKLNNVRVHNNLNNPPSMKENINLEWSKLGIPPGEGASLDDDHYNSDEDNAEKGACGGADGEVFEYDYPKGSLRAKMREADRTNPNVYSSIEELKGEAKNSEHLYEDIKVQKREADSGIEDGPAYDHLNHSRPSNEMLDNYQRMPSLSPSTPPETTLRKQKDSKPSLASIP
ncbi:unnamed protein product [Darwinula stevensoni]|uniref:EGF-like domain-containing protein n=1 Tax=Darwinula stevensoni TaxID=69355 RepID=A0A7R8X9R0_9CRUS|nr:unnamed protein product [Darwinula stevensoni]CAG0884768.1 unnamed protein product [Darwinula stevensoni]